MLRAPYVLQPLLEAAAGHVRAISARVYDAEGALLARVGELEEPAGGALSIGLDASLAELARTLRDEGGMATFLEGERVSVHVERLDDQHVLLLAFASTTAPGYVRLQAKKLRDELASVLPVPG